MTAVGILCLIAIVVGLAGLWWAALACDEWDSPGLWVGTLLGLVVIGGLVS